LGIFINRIMGILISIGNIHARYPGLVAAAHQPLRSPLRVILGEKEVKELAGEPVAVR
jgi:riboflavin biosynthesis pyrimidine reductase